MVTKDTLIRGGKNSLTVTWELSKYVVPVYILVTFLKYTPVLNWISERTSGLMVVVGLPGAASVPLVMGYTLNIYAAIGAMGPLELNTKQITIMAGMLLLAHSLPVEGAISKKTGVRISGLICLRIFLSFITGAFINLLF